jgi:hypothetical protein
MELSESLDGQIITLSGPRSKDQLLTLTLDQFRHLLSGPLDGLLGFPAILTTSEALYTVFWSGGCRTSAS